VFGIALGTVALLLAVSPRYGFHRDELYFLEAGKHLAWGYVDQPPFTALVARLADTLLGGSALAVRLLPAMADGTMVVLGGLTAWRFGGGRFAQVLAALGVGTTGVFLGASHLLSTTPFDFLAWALILYLVVRILQGADPRLWLAVGATAGVGLLNKWNMAFLLFGLAVGLAVSGEGRQGRSPWLWVGAALAMAIWSPNLVWQVMHGWPTLEMLDNLHGENVRDGVQFTFVPLQILYTGLLLTPIWIAGLRWMFRTPEGRPYRAIAWAYVVVFVLFLATAGKPYHLAGLYPPLLAAGSVATERWLERRRGRYPSRRSVAIGVLGIATMGLPIGLPILPAHVLHIVPLQAINYDLGETIGWPEAASGVARVYRSLPQSERATAVVLTGDYGEAGALDRYGPALGLPGAFSGHNSYWWWGPPPYARSTTIWVGDVSPSYLEGFWRDCSVVAHIDNGIGVENEEQGQAIWICRGQRATWIAIWSDLKHYG
jgi:4-amino-4-deoxy-L-arabinose transferase-like glycosyltransferase